MIIKEIKNWPHGLVTSLEPKSIPVGSLADALNFLTLGDKIELRRGTKILGTDQGAGSSVAGIGIGTKLDSSGTQVLFRKRKGTQKFEYYDTVTADWIETGSNACPTAAINDDFSFDTYQSQAGSQAFWSSPLSSIYKILVANPNSITDLLSTVYRGYIRIKQSRMFLWNRNAASGSGRRDEQNIYNSYVDARAYSTVTAEATTSLTGTLAFKAAGSKRTCFGVIITITASGEIYTDNRDGTLSGSTGGTGTINYTTGVYALSAAGVGTADYQWEDTTNTGIADFSFASPTRVAGTGNVFLQGDGGPLMGVETYGDVEYCAHKYKTFALAITNTDTAATNLLFRDREGVPNWRAFKGTSQGIFYVNAVDPDNPKIKILTLQAGSTAVDGQVISQNLDLSGYTFDKSFIEEWDDYIVIACRTDDSTINNRFILYNKVWKSFDIVDYWGYCSTIYNGVLVIGESITGNVVEVFSGFDDDGAVISGYAEINEWDLDYPGYLKACKKLQLEGDIGLDQVLDVKVSLDGGTFSTVGQIKGSGSYVDRSQRVNVGSLTLGRGEIGGGSSGVNAYHYFHTISLSLGKFERISVKLERGINAANNNAEGIGYFSLSTLRFYDIRKRSQKLPRAYRV